MRRSDLRAGMRVKLRHGGIYLVMTDVYSPRRGNQEFVLIREYGFMNSDEYYDDLTHTNGNSAFDVVEVFQITSGTPDFVSDKLLNLDVRHSIWKRDELFNYSKEQLATFKYLRELGFQYIAMDEDDGHGFIYKDRPKKSKDRGTWDSITWDYWHIGKFDNILDELVEWEDDEPFEIPEIKCLI